MTALCPGGGASTANTGASAVVLLASGFAAVVLDKYGARWLKWALPFLSLPELTLSTFCSTDPPAIPTFTAAESKALTDFQLGADFNSGLSKFGDLIQHLAWYELCHCVSGAATALPAAPAPPAGTPVYAPPPSVVPTGCQFVPGWASLIGTGSVSNGVAFGAGLNPTSFQGTFSWSSFGAGPHPQQTYTVSFAVPGLAGAQGVRTFTPTIDVPLTVVIPVPVGATYIQMTVTCTAGGTDQTQASNTWLYCNGDIPGVPAAPCCPPDPTLALQVEAILRMVTLIQRQGVPFGYVAGTAHTALSGAGSLSVSGLLGAKVDITTLPAALGRAGSNPLEIFDAGWITFGTPDGYPASYRLDHDPTLLLPARCSAYTALDYDLHPGVVVTITELLREP